MIASTLTLAFVDAYTPAPRDKLTATELAQVGEIERIIRGGETWDGHLVAVQVAEAKRYKVVRCGIHLYDAWIYAGWVPLVVFRPGGTEVLAWWGDQDSDALDGFAHADEIEDAYEAVLADEAP
jgi:hypothetical protein